MAYNIGGKIQAADFNEIIDGGAAIPVPVGVNHLWNDGVVGGTVPGRQYGYGQTPPMSQVAVGAKIISGLGGTPVEWQRMFKTINTIADHQGTPLTWSARHPIFPPVTDTRITWETNLATNIALISANRFNAALQGSTASPAPEVVTVIDTWSDSLTITFTASFTDDESARFFFNSGGQIGINSSHPAGTPTSINTIISDLCSDAGTVWLSAPSTGSMIIDPQGSLGAPIVYDGVTKIGGVNDPLRQTINTNNGFYALTSTSTQIFKQLSDVVYYSYGTGTFMSISASYNGTGTLTLVVVYDIVPDGQVASAGTNATMTIRNPSTSAEFVNSWGIPTLSKTYSVVNSTACPVPVIGTALSPTTSTVNSPYSASFTVSQATSLSSAIISGTGAPGLSTSIVGTTVNITGTPTTAGPFTVSVNATNACGVGLITSNATLSVNSTVAPAVALATDVLVIGGGGSGGVDTSAGGGGGAGGYIATTATINVGSYAVVVGAGGAGRTSSNSGNNGASSTFNGLTAFGGGGGRGSTQGNGASGGSGGGALSTSTTTYNGGAATVGQGFAGGNARGSKNDTAGGGGGSGGAGGNDPVYLGGTGLGGPATAWLDGVLRAGGGGSVSNNTTIRNGGGGGATNGSSGSSSSATANSGSGSGGSSGSGSGSGGSGVVIIRYAGSVAAATGGTITVTGGYVYHTFNTSGTFTVI